MTKKIIAWIFIAGGSILLILGGMILIYVETKTASTGACFGGGFALLCFGINSLVKERLRGKRENRNSCGYKNEKTE